jgi:hypothetical protein
MTCHKKAHGTLIQDRFRWDALRQANGVAGDSVFFLPIGTSVATGAAPPPHKRSGSSHDECHLLSLGVQGRNRFTHELVTQAGSMPAGMRLQLHGPSYDRETIALAKTHLPGNVTLCSKLLPEAELPALMATADIGLALYRTDVTNDRLTAYSSQKVAHYLRAGLPIIAFRSEAFADLFARYPCGEMIDTLDDLVPVAKRIVARHADYSRAALEAFDAIYRLDNYWPALADFLAAHAARRPA